MAIGLTNAGRNPSGRSGDVLRPEQDIKQRWLMAGAAGVVVLVLAAWAFSRRSAAQSIPGETLRTAIVERKDLVRTLRVHGTVAAVQSVYITAPRMAGQQGGQMVITSLVPAGMAVKPGDLLVEFDRQDQLRNAIDRRAEYLDLEEQIKRKLADNAATQAKDDTELEQARNALETAKLEMRRNEVISRIDAEKNQQNLEEAEARLKQLEQTYQLKKVARQADLRILEIRRDRARNSMQWAEKNAERMAIRSPMQGIAVRNTLWKGSGQAEVQEGDQVWAGLPILQVVDPAAMEVRSRVNQADIPYLRAGQLAEVRLDAYPNLVFKGKLERIAAIGVPSGFVDRVRTFSVVFRIEGSDPKLLPDLAAAVDTELERRPNMLVTPRDTVTHENGKAYVQVRNGSGWDRREVKIAAQSDVEVAVESGVAEGAVVLRGNAGSGR
jgi:biotin carboxyl carrier protein